MAEPSAPATTVGELLGSARRRLRAAPFEASPREAALLLARVLGLSEAGLRARPEAQVTSVERTRFETLLARHLGGEPVAYLFGEKELYGRRFEVDPRVLIPRPETEHLVSAALALELPPAPRVLDVGSGSGAIAVTLALELPEARVLATDVSLGALAVTRRNARLHGVAARLQTAACDLAAALELTRFDLVVSNPPYVDPGVTASLSPEVRDFEPHEALFAGDSGRALLAALLRSARRLRPGVPIVLEIGHDQSGWLRRRIAAEPTLELLELVADYAGIERIAVLRRR